MSKVNKQKEYIEKISKLSISPLYCSNNFFDKNTKKYMPGKRYTLDKYELKDYLTVGSNQIVFELDAKKYENNYKLAKKIITVLESKQIPFYIFSSGGKGIHIECWFKKLELQIPEIKNLLSEALKYQLSFKDIRFWIWNDILDEAGISENVRGIGKTVDSSCMNFNDLNEKTRLLRVVGGRKISYNEITDDTKETFKTYMPAEDFKKTKITETKFNNVRYPLVVIPFEIDENLFGEFLYTFIEQKKMLNVYKIKEINLLDSGGYTNLSGIKKIRSGLQKGQRAEGAKVLAIAMANDKLSLKEQEKIMNEYVNNCSQIGEKFTLEEGMSWVKWIEAQPKIFWNCALLENLGVHIAEECQFCKKQYSESHEFLENQNILKQVKDVLDTEIKGEDDTKVLMFLLALSKDFPSKTGKPEDWKILPQDPMSQNIILSADSSSGKSYMTKAVLKLIGIKGQDYFVTSRITKSVLNYYTNENMDGKVIFIEELQGLDEHTQQLRVWMSEGELNLETVEKIRNEHGIEENVKVRKSTVGQPVFISNQAEGKIEEQLNNRSWVLGMDTSQQQTQTILKFQDDLNNKISHAKNDKIDKIREALKLLKPYHFIVPFANHKNMNIPSNDVRSRRDYTKFLTLIKCSAYLHQYQREIVEKDGLQFIVCDIKDYDIAREYAAGILGATFSGLTISQIDLITFLKKQSWNQEFEIKDLMRNFGKTQPHWYGQLSQLVDLGYITAQKTPGKSTIYSLNLDKTFNVISLPSGNELLQLIANGKDSKLSENADGLWTESFGHSAKGFAPFIANQDSHARDAIRNVNKDLLTYKKNALRNKEVFFQRNQKSSEHNPLSLIRRKNDELTRIEVLEYIKKSPKSRSFELKIQTLIEKWPDKQDLVLEKLKHLVEDERIEIKDDKIKLL